MQQAEVDQFEQAVSAHPQLSGVQISIGATSQIQSELSPQTFCIPCLTVAGLLWPLYSPELYYVC